MKLENDEILSILENCPIGIAAICSLQIYWTNFIERALLINSTFENDSSSSWTNLRSLEMKQSLMMEKILTELRASKLSRKRHDTLIRFVIKIGDQLDITRLVMRDVKKHGGFAVHRDFNWKRQIRHYANEERKEVRIAMLDMEEFYRFEYNSFENNEPVIRTPLTDRCYHSLIESYRNHLYGGSFIIGPGNIGKTHTIESLARIFGMNFRILDCAESEIIDCCYIDNVFNSLIVCANGASRLSPSSSQFCNYWLCFKHLDLLTIRGLSIIAQRILSILDLSRSNKPQQDGSALAVIFVTGTISSSGNIDRPLSLPDSLKVLFRPIAMIFPDKRKIVEVRLFAEGFSTAAILAEKLCLFEKLSIRHSLFFRKENEDFYAGMRTSMYIVQMAGKLKHQYPNETEDAIFLRALIDVHLPKVESCHLTEFQYTIDDLFPNVALPPPNYENLLMEIRRNAEISANDRSLLSLKIIQLFETLLVRHAVVLVGSSLAGKTTIIDILSRSLLSCGLLDKRPNKSDGNHEEGMKLAEINSVRINHNLFTNEELFGGYDEGKRSGKLGWKDGVFTRAIRSFVGETEIGRSGQNPCRTQNNKNDNNSNNNWQWLILDGPLDTQFFDNIITLLDDKDKKLHLKSGEKILMTDSMSLIMETSNTIMATPATMSRCGIIYLEKETLSWKLQTRRWIIEHQRDELLPRGNCPNDENDEYAKFLTFLLEFSLESCLKFVSENTTRQSFAINSSQMVISVLTLFEMYLREAHSFEMKERAGKSAYMNNFFSWSQAVLLMSIIWAIGGTLNRNSQIALDEFCKSLWTGKFYRGEKEDKFPYEGITMPSEGLIQDNIYVFASSGGGTGGTNSGSWRNWSNVMKKDDNAIDYFWSCRANETSYVATLDSVKYINIFQTHVKYHKPFLVMGETATGKSLYMRHLFRTRLAHEKSSSGCIGNFFSLVSEPFLLPDCRRAQMMFLSKMKKIGKRVYRSPSVDNRICVNFVDDLGITSDRSTTMTILELIRQFYDVAHKCWYDVDSGEKIFLENVMFVGAINENEQFNRQISSKLQESARFLRHFNLYSLDRPADESIFRIYSNILLANLRANLFSADIIASVTSIVDATMSLYSSIIKRLRPVPGKFQYNFSLRDINRVIAGCSLIHRESAETKIILMRLWVHEILRVFGDRIVDEKDSEWLFIKMKESAESHFKDSWESAFDHLTKSSENTDNNQLRMAREFRNLIFSDFMKISQLETSLDVGGDKVNKNNPSNDSEKQQSRYEEINCSREALKNRANLYLDRYNEQQQQHDETNDLTNKKKLDMIIFPDMLEHLIKICRILEIPGGSLVIVRLGSEFSGTRSLVALAAHLKSQSFDELSSRVIVGPGESTNSFISTWREDLKRACINSSHIGGDCTFFITDRQLIGANPPLASKILLADVCSFMKTGQVANLLTKDERDMVIERSRLDAQKGDRNQEISSENVMDYYYSKCQEKLHFVLYFDRSSLVRSGRNNNFNKSGDFCDILEKILNNCSIDCYECWPTEAFQEIGEKFIGDVDIDREIGNRAIIASKYFYDSIVVNGTKIGERKRGKSYDYFQRRCDSSALLKKKNIGHRMPVSAYIHMMKLYKSLMKKRQNETRESRKRYLDGLAKLELAGEQVRQMKRILTRLRPELEESANETAETMRMIERENVSVENATIQVKREEQVANKIADVAGILKEECEADLAVAIPILEDAIAALNTLKPTDITLVKAMKNPPDTVKLVLAAVCVMLNVSPDRSVDPVTGKKSIDYWAPSKRILGDMNFLQNLKDYDKDNIPISIMAVVIKTYMNDDNFQPHIVAKASSAAEGLCKWVRAMVSYDEVAKVVAPKKEKLAAAEKECNASLEYLNEKRTSLEALNDKLAALNASLEATLAKKYQLENQVASCTGKLMRAEALITSLAGERARWLESAEALSATYENLAGDLLVSCGLIALLSSFDANHRNFHLVDWRKKLEELSIPNSGESYDFYRSLIIVIVQPSSCSRHNFIDNSFNQANSAILTHTLLTPLILDPQNQANLWIRRVESLNGLVIVKPTDTKWLDEIRDCVEKDLPVLLENLDRSDHLEKTPSILGYVGSFSASFRLYMTSRLSFNEAICSLNPRNSDNRTKIMSQLYRRFSIVNFSLTNEALENRLLEIVVSRERPELRDNYDRWMMTSVTNRKLLEQEEKKILAVLSGTNIIEDERSIEMLDRSKNLSIEIKRREAETARTTEREMNELCGIYRPLTKYCAALYETLTSLVYFNHMYRFSLDWFVRLYVRSIEMSKRSIILEKRLTYLETSFTLRLEASVRNNLLDEHKLIYSFLLSMKILLDLKRISQEEILALLDGGGIQRNVKSDDSEMTGNFSTGENNDDLIMVARQLADVLPDIFHNLEASLRQDSSSWRTFFISSILPCPWNNDLSDFQRLILVNRLKPEKTRDEVEKLVDDTLKNGLNSKKLHQDNMTTTADSLARSFDESSCVIPLIFVLPSYHEPFRVIEKWARKIGYSSSLTRFSMPPSGKSLMESDEYSSIECAIETARERGSWILLENCHLATDEWLARLERISESLLIDEAQPALTFRLWLTSYPSFNFPISILHNSVKIHREKPNNFTRENLHDIYANTELDDPNFTLNNYRINKNKTVSKLVYALCFFHAIVTGRNKFYERAWSASCFYDFADSDLKISIDQLLKRFNDLEEYRRLEAGRKKEDGDDDFQDLLETLVYLVGECYYGGRILDPFDRQSLNVILRDCCNIEMIRATTNYIFPIGIVAEGHEYSVPNRSEFRDFIRHIDNSIPKGESPAQIFGLDDNSAIIKDCRNSVNFIQSIATHHHLSFLDCVSSNECNCRRAIIHRNASTDSINNEFDDTNLIVEIILDIRRKLGIEDRTEINNRAKLTIEDTSETDNRSSCLLDIVSAKEKYPFCYEEPLNALLIEEIEIYNKIIKIIRESLIDVERIYQTKEQDEKSDRKISSTHMEIVDRLTRNFSDNTIPIEWYFTINGDEQITARESKSQLTGHDSLSRFIDRLSNRRDFFDNWIKMGHYKNSLWLGGLINCKKFISLVRLTFARKKKISQTRLVIDYEITKISTANVKPWKFISAAFDDQDPMIHIHGLYLSGARWDMEISSLVESLPKLYFDPMPMICLRSRFDQSGTNEKNNYERRHYYLCPVKSSPISKMRNFHFFGSLSTDYVMTMPLYSKEIPIERWIKRSAALFCNNE